MRGYLIPVLSSTRKCSNFLFIDILVTVIDGISYLRYKGISPPLIVPKAIRVPKFFNKKLCFWKYIICFPFWIKNISKLPCTMFDRDHNLFLIEIILIWAIKILTEFLIISKNSNRNKNPCFSSWLDFVFQR